MDDRDREKERCERIIDERYTEEEIGERIMYDHFTEEEICERINSRFVLLNKPGIFRLECLKTQRSIFLSSNNMLYRLLKIHGNFEKCFKKNKEILQDFKLYGRASFHVFVLDNSPSSKNPHWRKKKLRELKRAWTGKLY